MESPRRVSLEEYLILDSAADARYEYRSGYAVAFAAASRNHARVEGNLSMKLGPLARAAGCDFYAANAKVFTPAGDRLIPDFAITCAERDRLPAGDKGENIIRHPWLVIEILSPSTAEDDSTTKFDAYRTIDELTHYLTIDSRRQAMRLYLRDDSGVFRAGQAVRTIELPRLGTSLELDTIYDGTAVPSIDIGFSPPPEAFASPVAP
jgi:Uma2 family endonuclease